MIGSSPIASTPLGDDGGGVVNIELTANNLASQAPSIANATLTQNYDLTAAGITTGNPVVDQVTMAEDETFATTSLETGNTDVSSPDLTQDHSFNLVSFIAGVPVPQTTSVTQDHSLSADSVETNAPALGSPDYDEQSNLTPDSVTTQQPELGNPAVSSTSVIQPDDIITLIPDVGEPVDPNAVVAQEIKEIEQMFGGWPRRAYEVPDGRLVQAEREIEATYGDRVSIDRKAKSLVKFGRSAELGTTALETVWTVGGDEVYVTDNTISYISSSSASDTQQITIEGHTVDANGDFTFLVQTVTLDGQNAVALDTDVARVSRAYNSDSTELVGRVVVYENATVVGGIPTDETKIHIDIPQGFQQSFKAATTFSKDDYYLVTGFYGAVSAKQAGSVDFYVEIRDKGKVFLPKGCFTASSTGGAADISLDPAILVPKNADIRVRCETETNNVVVFGIFKGYLAKVLG